MGASDGMVARVSRHRAVADRAYEVAGLRHCFQSRTPFWISRYRSSGAVGTANRAYAGWRESSFQICCIPDALTLSAVIRHRCYLP